MSIPCCLLVFFFFNDTATTEIYTLSLHDALPISGGRLKCNPSLGPSPSGSASAVACGENAFGSRSRSPAGADRTPRSEEHTSELQSQSNLVCRLLLEKKKKDNIQ